MEGFLDTAPVLAKVRFAATEVALSNAQRRADGLLAETMANGVTTRWFVPWTSVDYIKQDLPAAPPPAAPTVIPPPVTPPPTGD